MNWQPRIRVAVLTGLMTVVAGWVAAAPAGAAAPQVFHQQIDVSFNGFDQCGFTLDSVVSGTLTFQDFVDRGGNLTVEQDEAHVVSTLTNEANGKVVYVDAASRDRFDLAPIANPDGAMTFTDTIPAPRSGSTPATAASW